MTLSPNFSFEELTRTGQASLQDANRREAEPYIPRLTELARMLEVVREKFGPVRINSGFRGPAVNAAVGGSTSSQHSKGEAADIVCTSTTVEELHRWIVMESGIRFGQCILEKPPGKAWVHLSLGEPYRSDAKCRESLTFDGKNYSTKRY